MTTWEYNKIGLSGIITIKTTAMEHSNKLTEISGNIKIYRTVKMNTNRKKHNQKDYSMYCKQKYFNGVSKTKGLPESITDIF